MRDKLILFVFNSSIRIYRKLTKKVPWNVSVSDLESYPSGSLGAELKDFLQEHHFSLQEKLENHDVVHVLTNTGVTVADEIGMQFYLIGNGKRNLYACTSLIAGLFYPEKIKTFRQQFRFGKNAEPFHQIDFRHLLHRNTAEFKTRYSIQSIKPKL